MREGLLESVVEQKLFVKDERNTDSLAQGNVSLFDNRAGEVITDPFVHAKNVYGGNWTASEWSNPWTSYENFATMGLFSGRENHCGPTAITNIIKTYGNKYSSTIRNKSNVQVFKHVMDANNVPWNPYFVDGFLWRQGTDDARTDAFIRESFSQTASVTVSTYGRYICSFNNIKNALTSSNRLMYIMTKGHAYYGNHAVMGYAYTRLLNNSTGWAKSYIKISDGWSNTGRYIDMADIASDQYWEVYF